MTNLHNFSSVPGGSQKEASFVTPSTVDNSLCWRLCHSVSYLIGGVTFPVASVIYLPRLLAKAPSMESIAGWLFTIGSFFFLVADLMEWNHYRPMCFRSSACGFAWNLGLNFLFSATGSLFYLLGSIYFIPSVANLFYGELFFIIGSAIIALSQAWKCYRTCVTPSNQSACTNINEDLWGFIVDLFAGLGGLFYLIGTVIYCKSPAPEDKHYVLAIVWWILGGTAFLISALAMWKRYYCPSKHGYETFN